ncbi:MAG: (2Fe-2S)-binding protein, partial [Varibaculum cambriense]|nr:(2Fe-2S)-binding protein [Varibaculum cambriense]
AQEAVPGQEGARQHRLTDRLQAREKEWNKDQIICECELVSRRMVEETIKEFPSASLDDLRRQLRIGMGPCQGGFCSMRCAGIVNEEGAASVERATNMISLFMKNRWIGIKPILFGESARETALDNWIMQGIFDLEHAPSKGQLSEVALNPVEQERDKQEREAVKEALA